MKILCLSTCLIFCLILGQSTSQLVRIPFRSHSNKKHSNEGEFLELFKVDEGKIGINDYSDTDYVGTISIGSPAKEFTVLLDTGSAQLYVPDASLASSAPHTFNCSASSTCSANTSYVQSISYGMGGFEGYLIVDQVDLGGLVIPKFNMLAATSINGIPDERYDGIMGLGIGRYLSEFPTVLEALKSNGLISVGTYSMFLGQNTSSEGSTTGELIFGGYDPKYAATPFQFVSVESENKTLLWTANMTAVGFGTEKNVSDITNFSVIFDSGTSYSFFPQSFVENIVNEAATAGVNCTFNSSSDSYDCDCSGRNKLPNLFFYFENATFDIPATSYILYAANSNSSCFLATEILDNSNVTLYNPAVLGDIFLNNYYGLYTQDNHTVGFAKVPTPEKVSSMSPLNWLVAGFVVAVVLFATITALS